MRKISTIINHRRIISHYTELKANHMTDLSALNQTALKFGLKRLTVAEIIRSNEKYYKIKKREFNKCKIKIKKPVL